MKSFANHDKIAIEGHQTTIHAYIWSTNTPLNV